MHITTPFHKPEAQTVITIAGLYNPKLWELFNNLVSGSGVRIAPNIQNVLPGRFYCQDANEATYVYETYSVKTPGLSNIIETAKLMIKSVLKDYSRDANLHDKKILVVRRFPSLQVYEDEGQTWYTISMRLTAIKEKDIQGVIEWAEKDRLDDAIAGPTIGTGYTLE